MENVIYNELLIRGFSVDIGVVIHEKKDKAGKTKRVLQEVDFVANLGSRRYYIQSAFSIPDQGKMEQEQSSLVRIPDFFKKIIVVHGDTPARHNEKGILILGIYDFLLHADSLEM